MLLFKIYTKMYLVFSFTSDHPTFTPIALNNWGCLSGSSTI